MKIKFIICKLGEDTIECPNCGAEYDADNVPSQCISCGYVL